MSFNLTTINWLAVLAAAVATFMIGGVWYTALFGKAWVKAHGYDTARVKELQGRRPPPVFFTMMIVAYLFIALALAIIIQSADIHDAWNGGLLGFAVWVVGAAVTLTNHLPTHVTWTGFCIDASYALIYCTGAGALLGAWQ